MPRRQQASPDSLCHRRRARACRQFVPRAPFAGSIVRRRHFFKHKRRVAQDRLSPVARLGGGTKGCYHLLIHSIHSTLNRGSPGLRRAYTFGFYKVVNEPDFCHCSSPLCSAPVFCATNSIWHREQPGARETHKWVATHQAVLAPADPIVARRVPKRGGFAPDRPIHEDQSTGVVPRSLCTVSQPIFVQRNLHRASPDVVGVNAQRPRYRAARVPQIHGEV